MRHVLLFPAFGVLLLLAMLVAVAGESPGGVASLLSDRGFWAICLVEAVLVGCWVIACEVAAARKWAEANAEETQKLVKLARADLMARGLIEEKKARTED